MTGHRQVPPRNRGLLERPDASRTYRGQQRRRQRAIIAAVVLGAVLLVAGIAVATSGVLGGRPSGTPAVERTATETPAATSTADATTTPAPAAEETATPSSAEIEIGWVGDTTPGSMYGNPPNEGRALFEYTREQLSAPDIMVANLEGTFGSGGPSKCDGRDSSACYAFQAPPANAAALAWAGIDVVNLANNHSNDYFSAGLSSTKSALDGNGIAYTGLLDTVAVKEVDGIKVAFLGFSPYPWGPSVNDIAAAETLVRQADETADVVVVIIHAGAEGSDKTHTPVGGETAYGENRGNSRAFAHAAIDAGADLVVGSGPHVIRGMEQYKGRLIAYSLGNFAGWKNFSRSGTLALSGLLTVRMNGDGEGLGGKWLALRIADPGVPKVDPKGASLTLVRTLSQEDFETPVVPAADGTFTLAQE